MKVSVVICTWNRADLLDKTLTRMERLAIPEGVSWELVIVNNNSCDGTDNVIDRHSADLPIVRLFEARPGKSHAANMAIEKAGGDLLIWTDDDVLVGPEWIASYVAAADRWPEASFFAGPIDPWFESEPPAWVRRNLKELSGVYAIAGYGMVERRRTNCDGVFGANMAFRMSVAKAFPLNVNFGRTRGELVGGDDTDVVVRAEGAGLHGVCVPNALVRHFVPASRLTKQYLWKWYRGAGRYMVLAGNIPSGSMVGGVPRWAMREYFVNRCASILYSPLGDRRWLKSFKQAARMWGFMQEARARQRLVGA